MSEKVEDILKQILLNMKYDSKKTLTENESYINHNIINEQTKPVANASIPTDYGDDIKSAYISYQTVIPEQILTAPMQTKKSLPVHPMDWHDINTPFQENQSISLFGAPCKILAGLNPKYPLGRDEKTDYFVKEDGTRCYSRGTRYWIIHNKTQDNTYDYKIAYVYNRNQVEGGMTNLGFHQQKGLGFETKPTIEGYYYKKKSESEYKKAKGEAEKAIKEKVEFNWDSGKPYAGYDDDCKPLDYNVCLRWSWKSLMMSGVNKGLYSFWVGNNKKEKEFAACVKVGGNVGDKNGVRFPWYSHYHNFYDKSTVYEVEIDGIKEKRCKDIKEIFELPEFVVGNTSVGSKSKTQMEELDKQVQDAKAEFVWYNKDRVSSEGIKKHDEELDKQVSSWKMGGIVSGK